MRERDLLPRFCLTFRHLFLGIISGLFFWRLFLEIISGVERHSGIDIFQNKSLKPSQERKTLTNVYRDFIVFKKTITNFDILLDYSACLTKPYHFDRKNWTTGYLCWLFSKIGFIKCILLIKILWSNVSSC